jgi:SAM-dependent methyltransferase
MEFARGGRVVFAVDVSPEMCRAARRKARRRGASVRVIQADMRTFVLPEPVDLVTCEFDAINHLPRKSDFDRVARAAARALRPGGWFYFDVNTRRAFQEIWPRCWFVETAEWVLAAHGGYNRRREMGWSNFDWFLPAGRLWRRFRERYEQVCWSEREIRRSLRRAGFRSVRCWDASELVRGVDWRRPGWRMFYLARKSAKDAG